MLRLVGGHQEKTKSCYPGRPPTEAAFILNSCFLPLVRRMRSPHKYRCSFRGPPNVKAVIRRCGQPGQSRSLVRLWLVAGAGQVLSDGRDDGFVGFAECAIIHAQIEARFLGFDARQQQRSAASGAGRAKPIYEFVSRDVSHSRQPSTSHGSNSITCPASANDNIARLAIPIDLV